MRDEDTFWNIKTRNIKLWCNVHRGNALTTHSVHKDKLSFYRLPLEICQYSKGNYNKYYSQVF